MIPKLNRNMWQGANFHREPRRKRVTKEWPTIASGHAALHSELVAKLAPCDYPEQIVTLFEAAISRCSSISMDANIMQGQPCISGTRIPVRSVLRVIEQYGSIEEAKKCYPHLTSAQIEDVLFFSQIILELPSGLDKTSTVVG